MSAAQGEVRMAVRGKRIARDADRVTNAAG
jgi:hypothetical protein